MSLTYISVELNKVTVLGITVSIRLLNFINFFKIFYMSFDIYNSLNELIVFLTRFDID